jgi:hypothetical protein
MPALIPSLAVITAAAGIVVGVAAAAPAAAIPECTNTGPTTTQCERSGNAQINTTPPYTNNYYPFGWPFWGTGITVSLGGFRL